MMPLALAPLVPMTSAPILSTWAPAMLLAASTVSTLPVTDPMPMVRLLLLRFQNALNTFTELLAPLLPMTLVAVESVALLLIVTLALPVLRPTMKFALLQTVPASVTSVVAAPLMNMLPLVKTLAPSSNKLPWLVNTPATYVPLLCHNS